MREHDDMQTLITTNQNVPELQQRNLLYSNQRINCGSVLRTMREKGTDKKEQTTKDKETEQVKRKKERKKEGQGEILVHADCAIVSWRCRPQTRDVFSRHRAEQAGKTQRPQKGGVDVVQVQHRIHFPSHSGKLPSLSARSRLPLPRSTQ